MKIGAIIQARTSSSRLPRKVLKPLPYNSETNVLQQVIRRVDKSELIDEIIVATSENIDDDEIVDVAIKENVKFYRGSLDNVLERYYGAADENDLDIVVRITSDCPLIDFSIIDEIIESHLDSEAEYTSSALIKQFPLGINAEVINFNALKEAYKNATENYEKEHVTPYIYKTAPDKFKINKYKCEGDYDSDLRITLDTVQDYILTCLIYDELYEDNTYFTLSEIMELVSKKPYIKMINDSIIQKKVCSNLQEELDEVLSFCNSQDLSKAENFIKTNLN